MRRRLRRCRLRHKIHAIKTRPNNSLRFLQRKNSIRRYLATDLTCAARKATFRTQKCFHNKQYPPKSKINRLNQSALILTQGLTKATLQCTVKPLFFFFLTKSQPFNKKQPTGTINHTNNQIKQSKISQSIIRSKQNITNTTNPSHHTPKFLNIKIIAG